MARILIIDDELHIRTLYDKLLSKDGYEVTTTATGTEALELIGRDNFDVIVLDIELGESSGLDLLNKIKNQLPGLPIILNSAYSVYMSNFKTWLAEDYIVKSSDIRPLQERIKELVSV